MRLQKASTAASGVDEHHPSTSQRYRARILERPIFYFALIRVESVAAPSLEKNHLMNIARKTTSILLLCMAASCSPAASGPDGTTPNATSAPSTPAPSAVTSAQVAPPETAVAGGPEVILHGKKLAIKSALVHSYGGQERKITLSTAPLTCDHIKARARGTVPNEQTIDLAIDPPLRGAKGQSIVTFSFPMLKAFPMTRTIISETIKPLPASVGGQLKTHIDLDHTEPDTEQAGAKESLRIKGEFDLKDCGVFPASEKGVPDPQTKVKVDVNGEEIAIQGAILVPFEKEYRLMLTSGANDCNRDSFSDVALEIRLSPGAVSPKSFILLGSRLVGSSQSDIEKSMKGISLKVPKAIGSAGQKVSLSLNGAITLPSRDAEVAVKVAGTVSALICAK